MINFLTDDGNIPIA
ncbi:hypothetical protein YPPY89_3923, partial [Yersinia pestis PY-89]